MALYLLLFHGRHDPQEQLDGWGFAGPIFKIEGGLSVTYACEIEFVDARAVMHVLHFVDDMVYYNHCWYGDFAVIDEDMLQRRHKGRVISEFDAALAAVPTGWQQRVAREANRRPAKTSLMPVAGRNLKLRQT